MAYSNAAFVNDENEVDRLMNNSRASMTNGNKEWDIFQENLDKSKRIKSDEIWKSLAKVLTISLTVLLLLTVAGAGLISRITLHIMIWHLNPPHKTSNETTSINSNVTNIGMSGNSGLSQTENTTSQARNTTELYDEGWIWSLFIVVIAPYVFTIFDCLKTICLKKTRKIHYKSLFMILTLETFHSIGLCCMVYIVLPIFYAPLASIVYLAVLFVLPIIDTVNVCNGNEGMTGYLLKMVASMFGFILQALGMVMVCFYIYKDVSDSYRISYIIIFTVSAILTSFKYWNTFTNADNKIKWLPYLKWIYLTRKTRIMLVVHVWKILLSGIAVLVIHCLKAENSEDGIKAILNLGTTTLKSIFGSYEISNDKTCEKYVPFIIAVINILSSYVCAKAAKVACVIGCQRLCFSIPLNVIVPVMTPVVLSILMYFPEILQFTDCDVYFSQLNLDNILEIKNRWMLIVAGVSLFLSLNLVSWHVWKTNGFILGKTQSVFNEPIYCGVFPDISLLLNRARNDDEYTSIALQERQRLNRTENPRTEHLVYDRPKIYACATMWHETEIEMTQLLKSIFRMDKHQHNLDLAHKLKNGGSDRNTQRRDDSNFCYDFEAHIFFDDAFDIPVESTKYPAVNDYVKSLISVMDKSAGAVHGRVGKLKQFTITKTPYGGRLTWELAKGNKLFVHLKDKTKIRHKKRWSQVMYMYYFFGHRLGKNVARLTTESFNTFLLALDGDVDFQPEAVMHLVRRMKKNPIVGAACGRIHPIGTGPLIWYQKFEYAVSHWLQKATEHVIGCVLCSPGCFSLFRGSALMDVLKVYTKIPTDARHFIQYDQGEDRWLCTLLLKHGYRVEYCAESDALTFAPEGFNEFYNQRRRWTPSTMANILDLLADWNRVVKENQNISTLYMFYQLFLFISSLLTPGTIFLMIVGAIIVGFPSLPPWLVLTLNVIPVGLFMLSCFFTKSQTQLLFAGILSAIYSILMMIVLVGILKEAVEEQFCSITTIFLCFVAGVFIVSAILHPMEASCIIHGILYFICIPSMSMLMILYSLGNLHVVSWGTREVKTATPEAQQSQTGKQKGGYTFSFGNIVRCIWCPLGNAQQNLQCNKEISDKFSSFENQIGKPHTGLQSGTDIQALSNEDTSEETHLKERIDIENMSVIEEEEIEVFIENEDKQNDKSFAISFDEAAQLTRAEQQFWERLILKYLKPLEKNSDKEKKVQRELNDLRNRSCLVFFLVNAFLVTVIYALTYTAAYSQSLSIDVSCDSSNLLIEPISITFTVVFGILLFIQFICLLFHRFSTLIHITATTKIKDKLDEDEELKIALDVLQRSRSVESKTSAMTDDFKAVFERKKKKRISQMIESIKSDNMKTQLDLDQSMIENLGKIPVSVFDVEEGEGQTENPNIAGFDKFVEKSGHLTKKETKVMKNFILTNKHKILQRSIGYDISGNTAGTSV